ncbi:mannose-1-phosphate guanylyltransferase [Croceicoccus sp. Ery15]|uniref:mannose-1-phosphate guanylyltransferase n=1 Tax=Croceicoccus sp. Ery15 TaxID=1703338 RepID=UPI001E51F400|nr:mannose-1-phosphate guanylyltransferase [Croceicoccus sp. Ery15]
MAKMVPVVLCGGSGTRLWPRSRKSFPKPFLPLIGDNTLFEGTLARCADADSFGPPIVVTGEGHLAHVDAQLGDSPGAGVIVEPMARNTAAAIAMAACRLPPETVMLVCPSDHHIADTAAFSQAAKRAADLADEGWLVAFGITATSPETGYGYIKRGEPIGDGAYKVERFVEKPDRERAQQFLADGGYSWNGGLFAFRADRFMEELEAHRPAIAAAARKAAEAGHVEGRRFHPDAEAFAAIESESVDYAVMENTSRAAMVPASMGWSDIGSWTSLRDALIRDGSGNTVNGRAELVDCNNVYVESDGPRVSVIGLDDVVVVVDGDEVLVTTAAGAQKVGKLEGAAKQ